MRSIAAEQPLNEIGGQWAPLADRQPTPEEAVALQEELEWLMAQLDAFGRRVLELRLQGTQLAEIAGETGRAERTVRRALERIRELLTKRREHAGDV
jgi:DNA-directed RNA polymerase specialized sigma24 family protein